jgi:hypothetical protein
MKPAMILALGGMLLLAAGIVLACKCRAWRDVRRSAQEEAAPVSAPGSPTASRTCAQFKLARAMYHAPSTVMGSHRAACKTRV